MRLIVLLVFVLPISLLLSVVSLVEAALPKSVGKNLGSKQFKIDQKPAGRNAEQRQTTHGGPRQFVFSPSTVESDLDLADTLKRHTNNNN